MRTALVALLLAACSPTSMPMSDAGVAGDAPIGRCDPLCYGVCGSGFACEITGDPTNPACAGCVARCEDDSAPYCEEGAVRCGGASTVYCYRPL